ncbi:hypothetical protein FHQ26_00605 [Testudinibacter sp. TR-2022]|uniref:TraK domain-containing protein n=1 Tax=Testudinibacter sp. TR-2022 TaxID=2585029 RepID=UPI001117DA64|nr:type-F conjugative transfer system secretin TraK [Testudinibacter sp. TR-2022]TNH04040.1 hypothetical protein FHQ22_05835 [Pasteurellaceae bacterium Phil31]TNH10175.1 hypothetical protein FHQ25_06140 [Testudinibacter sp. TR-2022]TNH13035.1 hypothetical protein FHQ26_00605 [Testudinibacter sp. TR-2022]
MKKYVPLVFLLISGIANSAVDVTANPFGSVNVSVSSKEPNVIHIKNDIITAATANGGALIQDNVLSDGSLIFSTNEINPFSIIIETEKGFTFTARATPKKDLSSTSLIIHNLADKGNKVEGGDIISSGYSSYSNWITSTITNLVNGNVPDGFVDTSNRKYTVDKSLLSFFKISADKAWVNPEVRVIKLDIVNVSNKNLELNERYFWDKKVMAITFSPQLTMISPKSKMSVYIMFKEVK